jgi:hypothetical protein
MSTTTSESGKSSVERKWASCWSSVLSGSPGNERLKLIPDGQVRV